MIDFNSKFGRFAKRCIKEEYFVWMTTVDSKGTPQPRPVWFIWEDDSFLIFSQPKAHKVKHILRNPNVALHFNTTDEKGEQRVIIFTGTATIDKDSPPAHKIRAYIRKYKTGIIGLNSTPEEFSREYSVALRIAPTNLRGWE
jgi:PPOX class probable F420-dependent enzyme